MRTILVFGLALVLPPAAARPTGAVEHRSVELHASLTLPDDWTAFTADELQEMNQSLNRASEAGAGRYTAGFRSDAHGDGLPFVLVQEQVLSTRGVTWAELEKALAGGAVQKGIDKVNERMKDSASAKVRSIRPEKEKRRFVMEMTGEYVGVGKLECVGFQNVAGKGMMNIFWYDRADRIQADAAEYNRIADSVRIEPGFEFQDSKSDLFGGAMGRIVGGSIVGAVVMGIIALFRQLRGGSRRRRRDDEFALPRDLQP